VLCVVDIQLLHFAFFFTYYCNDQNRETDFLIIIYLTIFTGSDVIVSNNRVIIEYQIGQDVDRSHHRSSLEHLRNITKTGYYSQYLKEECYALNFIVQLKGLR
jgi:hypothetical protein